MEIQQANQLTHNQMSDAKTPIFVDGMFIKDIPDTAPDYILGSYSIKTDAFKKFLDANEKYAVKGWLNITIKKSTKGSRYAQLDTYAYDKAQEAEHTAPHPEIAEDLPTIQQDTKDDVNVEDIPFWYGRT